MAAKITSSNSQKRQAFVFSEKTAHKKMVMCNCDLNS